MGMGKYRPIFNETRATITPMLMNEIRLMLTADV